jgi:hypothetical protein
MNTAELKYDYRFRPDSIAIFGGSGGNDLLAYADEMVVHPSWEGDIDEQAGDLAFILLKSSIRGITPVRVIDFPGPIVGESAIIVGYGTDPMNEINDLPLHREGVTNIIEESKYYYQIGGETNTCVGDSGGPMYILQEEAWVLAGVTSFGAADCTASSEGYSVKLLSFCGWLNDTMTSLVGADLGLEHCVGCDAEIAEEWGAPCGPGYPCCPNGTVCRTPEDFSNGGLGYCAPGCCDVGTKDASYCTDVAGGKETCLFTTDFGSAYCAISCDDDGDCPADTGCKNRPFSSDKICIAKDIGTEAGCDADEPDTDTESEQDDTETTSLSKSGKGEGCSQVVAGAPAGGTPDVCAFLVSLFGI